MTTTHNSTDNWEPPEPVWAYHLLLGLILLVFFLQPFAMRAVGPINLVKVLYIAILMLSIYAIGGPSLLRSIGLILVIPVLVLPYTNLDQQVSPWLRSIDELELGLALAFLIGVFLYRLLSHRSVTGATVSGAIVVYFFFGLLGAMVYSVIYAFNPGAYSVPLDPATAQQDLMYFSFVTMTTLGYGDISPVDPAARGYVMFQATVGQVYLVALVARLVALSLRDD